MSHHRVCCCEYQGEPECPPIIVPPCPPALRVIWTGAEYPFWGGTWPWHFDLVLPFLDGRYFLEKAFGETPGYDHTFVHWAYGELPEQSLHWWVEVTCCNWDPGDEPHFYVRAHLDGEPGPVAFRATYAADPPVEFGEQCIRQGLYIPWNLEDETYSWWKPPAIGGEWIYGVMTIMNA